MELRTVHSYSYLYILYCMCLLIPMIFILQHRRIVMLVYKQVTKQNFVIFFNISSMHFPDTSLHFLRIYNYVIFYRIC